MDFQLSIEKQIPGVFTFFSEDSFLVTDLHQHEQDIVHGMHPKRKQEFTNGRICAKKALQKAGITPPFISKHADGAPIWPEGWIGSISHTNGLTGCIVGEVKQCLGLGLDIERWNRVSPSIWNKIFTEKEQEFLLSLSPSEQSIRATQIFSAKEALYKFQRPITQQYLGFLEANWQPNLSQFETTIPLIQQHKISSFLLPEFSIQIAHKI